MPRQREEPDACEECGETDFAPNWLPEGQCLCDECAYDYWVLENECEFGEDDVVEEEPF